MARDTISRREFVAGVGAGALMLASAGTAAGGAATPRPATAGRIRFGVQTPPQHVTYQQIADAWSLAEELGFDSAFTFDHFMPIMSDPMGACFEGWSLLAALAARTQRLKVGVLVTGNTYRAPIVVAKMAATIDHVSNGHALLVHVAEPAPGAALLGAHDCAGMLMATVSVYFYGPKAEAAAQDQGRWQEWLGQTFPPPAG